MDCNDHGVSESRKLPDFLLHRSEAHRQRCHLVYQDLSSEAKELVKEEKWTSLAIGTEESNSEIETRPIRHNGEQHQFDGGLEKGGPYGTEE